jgi:chemotaxis protein CheD
VAVCLWDLSQGIGGTNHYLLPTGLRTASTCLRYGNVAIEELVERMLRAGAQTRRLRAKLFGGACVLGAMRGSVTLLGQKNIEIAHQWLGKAGIPIVDEDVGGSHGRKLIFHPHEGSAFVKLL